MNRAAASVARPVARLFPLLRAVARLLRTTATGLTLWLPGAVLATLLALLAAAWLWTGTANSLTRLVGAARPWVPALAQLSWITPGATVRSGGPLGNLTWQHNGLTVTADNVTVGWQWLAHDPQDPQKATPTTPASSRLRLTLQATQVHVADHSPARTTPLTPPEHLDLPWPFDSWAAPIELAFDIGTLTHNGASTLVVQHLNGQHQYNPAHPDWPHTLSLQAQVSSGQGAHTQARYTLNARAQAQSPLAVTATLTGDISGTLPAIAPQVAKPPARSAAKALPAATDTSASTSTNARRTTRPGHTAPHSWHGQLTATLSGTLATPQATLAAHATLSSRAAPGQAAPSAQLQAKLAPWANQPVTSLTTQLADLDLAALWPTLPRTRLSGHAQAQPVQADKTADEKADAKADVKAEEWAFDVALTNSAPGPIDQQRLPVTRLNATGHLNAGSVQTQTQTQAKTQAQAQAQAQSQSQASVKLDTLTAQVAGGQVTGKGHWTVRAWSGELTAIALNTQALHSALPATTVQGSVHAAPDGPGAAPTPASRFNVQLSAIPASHAGAAPAPGTPRALASNSNSSLSSRSSRSSPVSSSERDSDNSKQSIYIKRQATFSSDFSWDGQLLAVRSLELGINGAGLSAQGSVQAQPLSVSGQAQLTAPGLQLVANGQLSPDAGEGKLTADLLNAGALSQWLARLPVWPTTWAAPQVSGAAQLAATWQGGWQTNLAVNATAQAQHLSGVLPGSGTRIADRQAKTWSADDLRWALSGNLANWQTSLAGQLQWQQWVASLNTTATGAMGGVNSSPGAPDVSTGQARIQTLQLGLTARQPGAAGTSALPPATVHLALPAATGFSWDTSGLRVDAGSLNLHAGATAPAQGSARGSTPGSAPGAQLRWGRATWADAQLDARGELSGLDIQLTRTLARLFASPQPGADPLPGWTGDLALGGPWQLRWPGTPQAPALLSASVTRQSGDLQAPTGPTDASAPLVAGTPQQVAAAAPHQTLGIRTASVALTGDAQQLTAEVDWDSQAAGKAHGVIGLTHGAPGQQALLPTGDSALSGRLTARLPQAGVWSRLAPPGWRVTGSLALDATLGGTLAQPTWQGQLSARQLSVRSVVEGLEYSQGELDATLSSNRLDVTRFRIQGAGGLERGGSLALTGHATWAPAPATATVNLRAQADRLNVSARADRRLTVSGDVVASLADHTLSLRGTLKADQAQFTLADETAPTLGPDVVVRLNRSVERPPPTVGLRTDVAVDVDLGPAFDVRGQGLQARLTGKLRISSPPDSDAFRVTGEVRAAQGTYQAYGQQLRIEEGVLRFSGPYDDPTLAILALRGSANPSRNSLSNDEQQVGVRVTGSARNPRLQLYASPELPDSEKLAWLVLGRAASGAGAEAAVLQQAAMALLGSQIKGMQGGLATALGLDDISVTQDTTTSTSTSPSTAVTLGKRLSSRLYVSYQHSLNSTAGALNLFYDVSRRLTVRAQMGDESALDLIFTLPYD